MKSSARRPLQPKNIFQTPNPQPPHLFLKPKLSLISKENLPVVVESIDASLAQELSAFKKKLERLREDQERTEKLLEERDRTMGLQMAHLLERGEFQKSLEIQVDRLFRLKELHAYSSKISPIRSLRAKEDEKRKRFSFEPSSISGDAEEHGEEEEEEEESKDREGSSEVENLKVGLSLQ